MFDPQSLPRLRGLGDVRYLGGGGEVDISEVRCCDDRRRLSGPGVEHAWCLIIIRRGGFLRRANGQVDFYDAASAYLARPGQEVYIGHPAGPGDVCTDIRLGDELVDELRTCGTLLPTGRIATSGAFDLAHRSLLAACRRGDPLDLQERVYALLDQFPTGAARVGPQRPATAAAHRRLVATAREVLAADEPTLGLDELARRASCSSRHLSRVFHRVTGQTLTYYRNELRVRAVLEDLHQGGPAGSTLRELAAAYGFADQTHLTRVVRRHLGHTPGALARMLAG